MDFKKVTMQGFKIIGHRGWGPTDNGHADISYPENTLLAFDHAVSEGADGIEFDILLSKDKIPVVIHDRHLYRHVIPEEINIVAGRFVADFTFDELKKFHLGQGQSIPSLEELMDFIQAKYPEALLNMDVKDPELVSPLSKIIADRPRENIIISSYDWDLLRQFRHHDNDLKLVPAIKSALLFGADNIEPHNFMPLTDKYLPEAKEDIFAIQRELGAIALDCAVTDLKMPLIEWAAECNVGLQVSTSNDRVGANETNYELLRMLHGAAQEKLPFVICKVDEPGPVKSNLARYLESSGNTRNPVRAFNFY
ncbi:MAG: hypothetical protein DI586_00125 [Micavibrio aeruginosavorus]|uniref:GP-PDE domain-containing protein n=1 Tax=Micavibrio aeruginosavorus TaxID=349221 RepID=A0A2W5HGZ8_9BACT|nr:MAG: hypothetical protein DI586_00125 [Micavibrio aeruginosavorus]